MASDDEADGPELKSDESSCSSSCLFRFFLEFEAGGNGGGGRCASEEGEVEVLV